MTIPVLAFMFPSFLVFLVWGVMFVMNLWMFQKTKGKGNLFMMVGAGCLGISSLIVSFAKFADAGAAEFMLFWLPFIGAVLLVIGFYMTAKPVIDVHIETLKKKLHEVTSEKKGGGGDAAEKTGEESGES